MIDPTDQTYYYECFQPSPPRTVVRRVPRHGDGDADLTITNNGWPANQRWTTDTPIAIDPNNNAVIYLGGMVLGRSVNRGGAFTMISPRRRRRTACPARCRRTRTTSGRSTPTSTRRSRRSPRPRPRARCPTPNDLRRHRHRPGLEDDRRRRPLDAAQPALPERWVNAIVVDPADENHVYAAFSGYREGDDAANVYETHDGGTTWANISQNLPNGPVEMITYDAAHDVLYAATDVGVFDHKDGDSAWYKISVGLPKVPGARRQALGRRQVRLRRDFRPQRLEAAAVHRRDRRRRRRRWRYAATLALTRRPAGELRRVQAGRRQGLHGSTTANVVSTRRRRDAARSPDPGHLVNGSFALPQPLQVDGSRRRQLGRPGLQRPVTINVQAAHRRHRRAAHRQLQQDADVHAVDDEPVM